MSAENQSEIISLRNRHINKEEALQAAKIGVVIGGMGGVIYSAAIGNAPAAVVSALLEWTVAGPTIIRGTRESMMGNTNSSSLS